MPPPRRALLSALLACALLAGGAFARCPEGMKMLLDDEVAAALDIGKASWADAAKPQWCENFPEVINDEGLAYYETIISPYCWNKNKGIYHFTVETNNPCDEMKKYVGSFDVTTKGDECPDTWVGTSTFKPEVTAAEDYENLEPLECSAELPAASAEDLEGKVTQLLWETVVGAAFRNQTEGAFPEAYYCDESPGYKRINITDVSGCLTEEDGVGEMEARGVVEWVCAQQARIRRIGLTVKTGYSMDCEWVVVMDMGTEPEVIEPETTEEPAEPEKEER